MKNGICVKWDSQTIYTSEMGFQQERYLMRLGRMFDGAMPLTRRNYVCAECGFYEEYIVEKQALGKIAEMAKIGKRGWQHVSAS
jgi:hypothetical protein